MDCTTDTYDSLYSRWLKNPGALLDWAKYDPSKHKLLDLCGGTGAISREALRRGAAKVWLLDLNPRIDDPRVRTFRSAAENIPFVYDPSDGEGASLPNYDLIVCRQALGYLNLRTIARTLRLILKPGGRFVFNTFVRPKFSAKFYRHEGRRFFELSGYLGKQVMHLQATNGDFDVTKFRWWTEEDIEEAFETGWSIADSMKTDSTLWYSFKRKLV